MNKRYVVLSLTIVASGKFSMVPRDEIWGQEEVATSEDGCDWLIAKGIKAYVSDTYNDSPLAKYGEGGHLEPSRLGSPTHHKFLKANVILVEYVTNLGALTKSRVELVCLPLKLFGVGQAPARVVAIENDGLGRGISRRRRTALG